MLTVRVNVLINDFCCLKKFIANVGGQIFNFSQIINLLSFIICFSCNEFCEGTILISTPSPVVFFYLQFLFSDLSAI